MFALKKIATVTGEMGMRHTLHVNFNINALPKLKCICSNVFMPEKYYSSLFSKTLTHSESKTIPVPPDVMYEVVADVESYKEFVPWCTKSTVTEKTLKTAKAQLSVGFGPIQEHYNSTLVYNKPVYIKSICTDGMLFNLLDCTWRFSQGNSPSSCKVYIDLSFEFRSLMYSRLSKLFFDEIVEKMVYAFEKRARRKYVSQKNQT